MNGSTVVEMTATFIRERHRWENEGGDTIVADVTPADETERPDGAPNGSILSVKSDRSLGIDVDELQPHLSYHFYGVWRTYREADQFVFSTYVEAQPHGREGIIAYLRMAGKNRGIGPGLAAQIHKKFGSNSIVILRTKPEVVAAGIPRLKKEVCIDVAKWLVEKKALEDVTIETVNLIGGRGFPKNTPKNAIDKWGNQAPTVIAKNPFDMLVLPGCGFKRTDALWCDMGLDPAKTMRQAFCAWHAVETGSDGHTWFPASYVVNALNSKIGGTKVKPMAAIKGAIRIGKWVSLDRPGALALKRETNGAIVSEGGSVWLAEGRKAWCESRLANNIVEAIKEVEGSQFILRDTVHLTEEQTPKFARCTRCNRKLTAPKVFTINNEPFGPDCITKVPLGKFAKRTNLTNWLAKNPIVISKTAIQPVGWKQVASKSLWPDPLELRAIEPRITDHQLKALGKATAGRVGILGGSPGTGKTFTAAILIKWLCEKIGPDNIIAGAPTGKAAVRLTELLESYGVNIRARTWHSILGIGGKGAWDFAHNESNPLEAKVLIGDEESMKDTNLMSAVFAARARGTHVLLIGDVNQLPPVGHGAPLRDFIAAGLPYGELTTIMRNSGGIVEACAAIRDGKKWKADDNLIVTNSTKPDQQISEMLSILEKVRQEGKYDPIWDCQVLVAVNDKSPLSRKRLNEMLQSVLNSNPADKSSPFRVGDKIVNTQNSKFPLTDDCKGEGSTTLVANGELGEVIAVEPNRFIVELKTPKRTIVVPRGKPDPKADEEETGTGCSWQLGYALSTHKSQGSEWPIVITMIDEYPGARRICCREWLYTAISRAKVFCYLVGRKTTADMFCRNVAIGKRRTFLKQEILRLHAELLLEAL